MFVSKEEVNAVAMSLIKDELMNFFDNYSSEDGKEEAVSYLARIDGIEMMARHLCKKADEEHGV